MKQMKTMAYTFESLSFLLSSMSSKLIRLFNPIPIMKFLMKLNTAFFPQFDRCLHFEVLRSILFRILMICLVNAPWFPRGQKSALLFLIIVTSRQWV